VARGAAWAGAPCRQRKVRRRKLLAINSHQRRFIRFVKLQRIRDQILKQLSHLQRIRIDRWHFSDFHVPAALLQAHFEIASHFCHDLAKIACLKRLRATRNAGKLQQILDECLHAARSALHPIEVIAPLLAQLIATLRAQPIAECLNFPERFLQVVRRDTGEALQLRVAPFELCGEALQLFFVSTPLRNVEAHADETHNLSTWVAQWNPCG